MLVLTFLLSEPLEAQGGMRGRGPHYGAPGPMMYDTSTVETVKGEVTKVDTLTPAQGMGGGMHLLLKTANDSISVHLGPSWYLNNQGVKIKAGDLVTVTGSQVTYQNTPALIASQVKVDERTVLLRRPDGIPLWSGAAR